MFSILVTSINPSLLGVTLCSWFSIPPLLSHLSLSTSLRFFSFDIDTLAQVRQLTLIMVGGTKVSFSISDAVKHDGDRMVTFMTSSGGKIVVDGVTKIARATVAGACYLVDGTVDEVAALGSLAGRQLNSNNGDDYHYKRAGDEATRRMPRLYTKEDFFTERRGFVKGGRKLGTARDGTSPQKGFGG